MRKLKRIISVLIIAVLLVGFFSVFNSVQAITLGEMQDKMTAFESAGADISVAVASVAHEFSGLAKILTTSGAGVLVIVITYMGIKYFISTPEEQAKLKGQLIGLVVSALVIFGATAIWKIAIGIFRNM